MAFGSRRTTAFPQTARDAQPIDSLYPVEMGRCLAALVALQMADKMPARRATRGRFDLVDAFLDEILAEIPLSSGHGLDHRRHRMPFAHGHQADPGRVPGMAGTSGFDPLNKLPQPD